MSKSYNIRNRAAPLNHSVYELWGQSLGLGDSEFMDLKNRGLSSETIKTAGYATKLANNNGRTLEALNKVRAHFEVEGVPGFFVNDKDHWTQSGISGIAIPVRDVEGHIASILVRNAKPTERNGKVINKYVAFSSAGKDKGSKVWQTTHCPIVKGLPKDTADTTVRITEGVLKADIATAMGNIYCLGMQGLKLQSDFEQIIEELEISELRICIDSGEDENVDIIRCRADIITRATKAGIDVKVEIWDAKFGKGLDDVLHAGHSDKIRIATEEEVDEMLAEANSKNPNNGEFIYVISVERFISMLKDHVLKKSQFADKFQLEKTEHVNQMIASGFPQVDTITYWPGQEKILTENFKTALNEWMDPQITPKQGDISVFTNHLKYLIGEEYTIILDWLAFQIQNPGEKILWMPVIVGGQGVGKSFLGQTIVQLFGSENVKFPMNEQLEEKYNDWQRKAQIVVIEELMAKGKISLMNKLKPLITEPLTKIRLMGTDAFPYKNRFNMIGFTNYNNALKLEVDDRRYCILKSDAIPKHESYYNLIWSWLGNKKNIQALQYDLLKRDLTPFKAKGHAPQTTAKLLMIKDSRSNLEEWIEECIADNEWPFNSNIVAINHLKSERVAPRHLQGINNNRWAEALKRAGAVQYPKQVSLSNKSRVKVWVCGQHDIHLNLDSKDIKILYEKWLQSQHPGGNPLADSKPF